MANKTMPTIGAAALAVIFSMHNAMAGIPAENQSHIMANKIDYRTLALPKNVCKQLDTQGTQILEKVAENFFQFIKQGEKEARQSQQSVTFTALDASFNQQQILSDDYANKLRNNFSTYLQNKRGIEQRKKKYDEEIQSKNHNAFCDTPQIDNYLATTGKKISLIIYSYFTFRKDLEAENKNVELINADKAEGWKSSELELNAQ